MSKNYEKIKAYYDNGVWDKQQVFNVVGKTTGITEAEYEQITGTPYSEETYPEPVVGVVHLHDFSISAKGTLLSITSDTSIAGASTGRLDLPVPEDMREDWAVASLAKWEFFNGNSRVDAVPCFEFSMDGQKVLRCGFRTSGTEDKPYTRLSGALLLKRR